METFKRGDTVSVKVIGGEEVLRRVWGLHKGRVLVTNDEEFQKMIAGRPAIWPVAFPIDDVRLLESNHVKP